MLYRVISVIIAVTAAARAQTADPQTAKSPAIVPKTEAILRQYLKEQAQGKTGVCSITLLRVPINKDVEEMPKLVPPPDGESVDHMPFVKLPAPPCEEEQR